MKVIEKSVMGRVVSRLEIIEDQLRGLRFDLGMSIQYDSRALEGKTDLKFDDGVQDIRLLTTAKVQVDTAIFKVLETGAAIQLYLAGGAK